MDNLRQNGLFEENCKKIKMLIRRIILTKTVEFKIYFWCVVYPDSGELIFLMVVNLIAQLQMSILKEI